MAQLFEIDGYYKDDKSEFNGYLVYEYNDCPNNMDDDNIFFYGMSEAEIELAIKAGEDTMHDFVITNYKIINDN